MNSMLLIAALTATNVVTELEPVIVEASRMGRAPMDVAGHVTMIDGAAARGRGERSLPEMLTHSASVDVWHPGTDNPALAQLTMRGYGENGFGRVLVMADGENLANPDMTAPNYARLAVGGIDRIEILHGPQTVLYGDGASAGMINVVTDDGNVAPLTYLETHVGTYGSAGAAAGTRGRTEAGDLSWRANGGYDRSDGYRDHSAFSIWNVDGALRQDFANGAFLRLSSFFSDADFDLPGPLSEYDAKHNPRKSTYADHGRTTSYGLGLSGKGVIDDENEIDFTLSVSRRGSDFSNRDYTDIYGVLNRYRRDYESDITMIRFAPQFANETPVFDHANSFRLGVEGKYALLTGKALTAYPDWALETREKYDLSRLTGGVFVRDELFVLEQFSISGGARLERDWNRNNVAMDGGRNDNFTAGEAALNYHLSDAAKVFLRWSRFYRNPFIDEYRWRAGSQSATAKPETGWVAELGGRWEVTREFFVSGDLHYAETDHEIHYNPFLMSNENSPWLHRRQGVDLDIGWRREKTAELTAGWSGVMSTKAEGLYKWNWVPGVPRQIFNLEGRLWLWDEFDIFGGYRLTGARYAISDTPNANGRLGADGVFTLGWRYRPDWLEGLTVLFACDNLFDDDYCDYAVASVVSGANAYYPARARTFTLTIRYEF